MHQDSSFVNDVLDSCYSSANLLENLITLNTSCDEKLVLGYCVRWAPLPVAVLESERALMEDRCFRETKTEPMFMGLKAEPNHLSSISS